MRTSLWGGVPELLFDSIMVHHFSVAREGIYSVPPVAEGEGPPFHFCHVALRSVRIGRDYVTRFSGTTESLRISWRWGLRQVALTGILS
jgi:hypothetical protein